MAQDSLKLELLEWLSKLEDNQTLEYLKLIKDRSLNNADWWKDLSKEEKEGIESGLADIEAGRTFSHEEVKQKYGL